MKDFILHNTLLNDNKYYTIKENKKENKIIITFKDKNFDDKYNDYDEDFNSLDNQLIFRIDLSYVKHNYNYEFDFEVNKNIHFILIDNSNLKFESFFVGIYGAKFEDDTVNTTFELHNIHSKIFNYSNSSIYCFSNSLYNCHFDKQILN